MRILLFGGPGWTSPGQVWSANPDNPLGPISTIRLDLTFDQSSWSCLVLLWLFGYLIRVVLWCARMI